MTTHLKSMNRKIWEVVDKKFEVENLEAPTAAEEVSLKSNDIALSAIHDALDEKVFEQIKNLENAHEAWKKLEESFEGTQAIKSARSYILKEKFTSFKMQEGETMAEMFYRLLVIVNDLKNQGEKVKDKDFSHKFLRCLPPRFDNLVTILVRSGLDAMTPNQVLGDVVTQDTYRVERDGVSQEDEKKKKKSVAFKAGASSKSKGKKKKDESSDEECSSAHDDEDEEMALFVKRFGKFMKKKGYGARRRKASSKNKEEPRRCFKCKSKDHLIADCPYNSDNDDDNKKDKKMEKKMTFKKKKKGQSYCVTWDSDASSSDDDDDSSDDERKTAKKKALASITIHNKTSLFDAPSTCFITKATKVQSDDESDSESEDEEECGRTA
ncbi:uncharacterized protein [Miscanthus floridulus]|uniref:uncharacterized protein n=1 Tax=Miscanthus floridulus TaxID=154761 RepID=UPI003458ADC3